MNTFCLGIAFYSACFDGHRKGVSWLVSTSLDTTCAIVYADPGCRICMLDITIKDNALRLNGVYFMLSDLICLSESCHF